MKKNGFTLIEVLAIIIIIGALSVLVTPNLIKLSNDIKNKKLNKINELIITKAKLYVNTYNLNDNIKDVVSNKYYGINLQTLINDDIFSEEDVSYGDYDISKIIILISYSDGLYNYVVRDNTNNACVFAADNITVTCSN